MDAPDPLLVLRALGIDGASASPVPGGSDTVVWRVAAAGRAYALRLFPPGRLEGCRREVAVMAAAAAGGVPVPVVRATGVWEGRAALLADWCPGRTVFEELARCPGRARHLGRLFGATQARIHRVAAPAGLGGEPWTDAAGPWAEALRQPLRAAGLRTGALLHLDYHFLNVLTDGERITGVIDWANARPGDPRADLARTLTILRLDVPSFRAAAPLLPVLPLFDLGWRRGYARVAGPGAADSMGAFYAWAGAAMARDLAGRRDAAFLAHVEAFTARWAGRVGYSSP